MASSRTSGAASINEALAARLRRHGPSITQLPEVPGRDDLLVETFRTYHNDRLSVFYAPIGYVVGEARLALVGITPGWTQMQAAFRFARAELTKGTTELETLRLVKHHAAFRGPMRRNLVAMLDALDLAAAFDVESLGALFDGPGTELHSTSALRYPVFRGGQNYTGYGPRIGRHVELTRTVRTVLAPELAAVPHALVVPLGRAAEEAVKLACKSVAGLEQRTLSGFPHPSGANGHRVAHFKKAFDHLRSNVARWRQRTS